MSTPQLITPCLWFDFKAEEAVAHYLSIFEDSTIETISHYGQGPHVGEVMTILFSLRGQRFLALNGGPHYQFTPAVSLMVNCRSSEEAEEYTRRLTEGGSMSHGWLKDRYGLSWQVIFRAS